MKSINLFSIGNFSSPQQIPAGTRQNSLLQQEIKDTYTKSPNFTGNVDVANAIKKSYETLPPAKIEALRENIKDIQKTIKECVDSTKMIANYYNSKYGENNWEYISIGRSCAPFASILNKLGIKTYIIPISGIGNGVKSVKDLTSQKGFEDYKNFIYNLGLNPQTIKNSEKTYIFQDYAFQGRTIKTFEELIRSKEMGLNFENIKFESINDALFYGLGLKPTRENLISMKNTLGNLTVQNMPLSIKNFTDVPKLHWSDLGKITTLTPVNGTSKEIFDFGVTDILNNEL